MSKKKDRSWSDTIYVAYDPRFVELVQKRKKKEKKK